MYNKIVKVVLSVFLLPNILNGVNVMKNICLKLLVVAFVVVLIFNSIFIVAVSFIFEKEAEYRGFTQLEDILKNENKNLSYEDFLLLNWAGSRDDAKAASKLPESVKNAEFKRCDRVESVFVQLLQTKNNSIVQLFPAEMLNDNNVGGANPTSFLEIWGSYYLVVCVTENNDLATAVYKTEDDLSGLYEFETDKACYSFYEFYPACLAPLFATTFDKILNVLFVIAQMTVVYIVLVKRKKKSCSDVK